jgi:DNA replication protein DnaC
MSEKIDETLKKIASAMSKENSQTSSNIETESKPENLLGEPDCPHCQGLGYLRKDVPLGHPDFGKVDICTCRHKQIAQQVGKRLYALSNLEDLHHLTFENFKPRGRVGLAPLQADSLERAYNHSRQFSQNLNGWLLLQGPFGCGKTHLAAAIGNFAVSMGVPTLFLTIPDLLDTLRFAFDSPDTTFEERFEEVRNSPLLILDDFGTQNATPWAQEKLFQIINYRYINHLPLVVTTNLALEEIEARISSRLRDPEIVTRVQILANDYRDPMDDTGYSDLSSLSMHRGRTFASFDLRKGEGIPAKDLKSLEKAFQLARQFAEKPSGWLLFTGPHGSGKTHLAAAISYYRADLGERPIFVVVPDLLDHLRATFSPSSAVSYDRRFEEVKNTQLLIMDDLGTQSTTAWAREKLYQLFNFRYNAELPTVITTADTLDDLDPRLRSRILDTRLCTVSGITVPSYRGVPRRQKSGSYSRKSSSA